MISGTITDASGRTLTGQTTEAFWNSLSHAKPVSIGLNCALGAKELRQYIAELSRISDTFVSAHPNAGLPNEFGQYDESPEAMAGEIREWAASGLLNIVGGCCGTTPAHITAIAAAVADLQPRLVPEIPKKCRLSGLEPCNIGPDSLFVNVGERTNVTGSARFKRLILEGNYDEALSVARQQVESGAQIIDINMDEGMLDGEKAMVWDSWDTAKWQDVREFKMKKNLVGEFNVGYTKFINDEKVDESMRERDEYELSYSLHPTDSLKVSFSDNKNFFGLEHKDKF